MPKIHGIIIAVDDLERVVTLQTRTRRHHLTFQRAAFNKFFKYLIPGNRLFAKTKAKFNPRTKTSKETVLEITLIIRPSRRKRRVLFSQSRIQHQTHAFVESLKTKMFLDLEMSMHPYKVDKDFKQEIIQAGYVLVDKDGHIIEKYMAFIKPTRHKTLTKRTLKFLKVTQQEVDAGIDYETFNHHFIEIIKKHKPAIIVWGKNDHIALKECATINQLDDLPADTRFVNLLMLHKNYFGLKDDLGLANAYKLYGNSLETQAHDALEDAIMTMKIFNGFKAHMNGKIQIDGRMLKR